jgi:hypothetical protein
LFEQRFWAGIADGSVTLAFRRWRTRRAVPGAHHRTPGGIVVIDSVDLVDPASITDRDAARAGYATAAALRADLDAPRRGRAAHDRDSPADAVYRVAFHLDGGPDPRAALAADADLGEPDVAGITARLARLDRASTTGPWTGATLRLIAARPATRATDLATALGRERDPFKRDVRKLKALGLTESLEVGYQLSRRGAAYLAAADPAGG